MTEVSPIQRAVAPYSQIGLLVATFVDGSVSTGACSVVGRNDILTSTSAIFNPDKGGWATNLNFYFGADYNSVKGALDSAIYSLALTNGFAWTAQAYPNAVYSDAFNSSLTASEAAHDLAIIGVSIPIGDTIGRLAMDPAQDTSGTGTGVGYPQGTTGMQTGSVPYNVLKPYAGANVYGSVSIPGADPGSTGSPLLVNNSVIGVRSPGQGGVAYWADIGNAWTDLLKDMTDNDYLLARPGETRSVTGTSQADTFLSTAANDVIDGGAGVDTALFAGKKSEYIINAGPLSIDVTDSAAQRNGHDTLINVERLHFADCSVAFDINGAAGQAYRLYKAAFDRAPDLPGLGYQMHQLDLGYSLTQVASAFIASPEFQTKYGDVSDTQFITLLYRNVLDREPDAGGLQFHLNEIAHGESRADVLTHFSESPENQANVIGSIAGGMTFIL